MLKESRYSVKRTWTEKAKYTTNCAWCGVAIHSSKPYVKTCKSVSCRVALWRHKMSQIGGQNGEIRRESGM